MVGPCVTHQLCSAIVLTPSKFIYFLTLFSERVTAAATDSSCKFVAVGSSIGEAKVLNLKSGGVLYDLPRQDKEITCL